jgi:hypothetical protein
MNKSNEIEQNFPSIHVFVTTPHLLDNYLIKHTCNVTFTYHLESKS